MIAYHFRTVKNDKPTGWIGFAFAQNMEELFCQIDNHTDPYQVEIRKALSGSAYVLQTKNGEYYYDEIDYEMFGHCTFDGENGWKKPKWVTDPDFEI